MHIAQSWTRHQCWCCRSVFGEDALVNVSVEKQSDGKLAGFIRIRSKTQVRALQGADAWSQS